MKSKDDEVSVVVVVLKVAVGAVVFVVWGNTCVEGTPEAGIEAGAAGALARS